MLYALMGLVVVMVYPLGGDLGAAIQSFNPEVCAVIGGYYHHDLEGCSDGLIEEVAGFGGGVLSDEAVHNIEPGFNMRHLELSFTAAVDPYFRGTAMAALSEDGAEIEEAVIETIALPYGMKIKAGKFLSDIGYLNPRHAHEWDFVDGPLVYRLLLGEHGLNDLGVQCSWLAPSPFYLVLGMEALQGKDQPAFAYSGQDPLPSHQGPRVWAGWARSSPPLPDPHVMQIGLFCAQGIYQDTRAGNWFDGDNLLLGLNTIYRFDSRKAYGHGDLILQAEYIRSQKTLQQVGGVGSLDDKEDGYYIQAVYGFAPRWRGGLRWDHVGLVNQQQDKSGAKQYGSSWRISGMVDFSPTEFSRLRFQVNNGRYNTTNGKKDVVEIFVQLQVSIGAHGAHPF